MENNLPPDILLVEDNPSDEELTLHALSQKELAENIKVIRDGAEALDFLFGKGNYQGLQEPNPPRLILLDLKLPKVNGLEVLEKIKAHPQTRNIPVVVFSSSDQEQDIRQSYALGANSFITKPVDFNQFSKTVQQVGSYWLKVNQQAA
ncbi:MAG: response regulator [Anaerolineales bacterium]|nr:response regulator [Anaerolineales bacterium]